MTRGDIALPCLIALACSAPPPIDPPMDAGRGSDAGMTVADCAPRDPRANVVLDDGRCVVDDADDDNDGASDGEDCAPLDPARSLRLDDGSCVRNDGDDDDDGVPDDDDCAPSDPSLHFPIDGGRCLSDDVDDDDDGVVDVGDCAPRDGSRSITLVGGACVRDDADDDDDGVEDTADCEPLDASVEITLASGACVADTDDDDVDGVSDTDDCAPTDASREITLTTAACVADTNDDDADATPDAADCAPLDPIREVTLPDGRCVADDADDDDDGVSDGSDCAYRDASRQIVIAGSCVADDDDDDDDGVIDTADCAPRDPSRELLLVGGACAANDDDDDDDRELDASDCAPLDPARWLRLPSSACVADDDDDDDDGASDGNDCSPRDPNYAEGLCDVGELEVGACGSDVGECTVGSRTRRCGAACTYGAWSTCGNVGPAPESCGDARDEDCDGSSDEGCDCAPVAPGAAGAFFVAGDIRALQSDPVRCLLYGFDLRVAPEPSQLVVIDTRLKRESTRIVLGTGNHDFDIASDGSVLVVAHPTANQLLAFQPPSFTPRTINTGSAVSRVEVGTNGYGYILRGSTLTRIDLTTGASGAGALVGTGAELALSPDETRIYSGSASSLQSWNIGTDGTITRIERSPSNLSGRGGLALSADGRVLGWSGRLVAADDLQLILGGGYGWSLYGLDARGTIAIGSGGIVDVERLRPIATSWDTIAAALTAADHEVWYYETNTGRIHYANIADFLDRSTLGRREWPPRPAAEYTFTRLVVDPSRPWIYAIDGPRGEVVVFDRATLAPVIAVEVGNVATEADMDPAGRYLYVGHEQTWAIARIDPDQLAFAGLVPTHTQPFEIVVPRAGRVVAIAEQQRDSSLVDSYEPNVLAFLREGFYRPSISASVDGHTLFVGDSGTSADSLAVVDTAGDVFTMIRELPFSQTVDDAPRGIVTVGATNDVFWARGRWSTDTLTQSYPLADLISIVTPDGRLAISRTRIYDARTAAQVGALPVGTDAQAVSPDGRTLYLGFAGGIRTVDLTPYRGGP